AESAGLPFLGDIPLAASVRVSGDAGIPAVLDKDPAVSGPFKKLAEKVAAADAGRSADVGREPGRDLLVRLRDLLDRAGRDRLVRAAGEFDRGGETAESFRAGSSRCGLERVRLAAARLGVVSLRGVAQVLYARLRILDEGSDDVAQELVAAEVFELGDLLEVDRIGRRACVILVG